MNRPHPHSNTAPAPGDHRGWAAYWGEEAKGCIVGIELATLGHVYLSPITIQLMTEHAVRVARLAWMHACRASGYRYWNDGWRLEQERLFAAKIVTKS